MFVGPGKHLGWCSFWRRSHASDDSKGTLWALVKGQCLKQESLPHVKGSRLLLCGTVKHRRKQELLAVCSRTSHELLAECTIPTIHLDMFRLNGGRAAIVVLAMRIRIVLALNQMIRTYRLRIVPQLALACACKEVRPPGS